MKIRFLIALLGIGLFYFTSRAQQIDHVELNNYLDYITKENGAIGNISIFKDGKEVYNRHFGQSNIKDIHFTNDTQYHIGSITKLFTATLIWQLIEKEELHLEDRLVNFFPDMPNAKKITIKNLLEHTSGLDDYTFKNEDYYWLQKPVTKEAIFNEIKSQGVLFQPGEQVSYSNSGYYLLAKIVEMKYKNTYSRVLYQQITQPLNLKFTTSAATNPSTFQAYDYHYTKGKWQKAQDNYFINYLGVGDMVSTPKELNEFITQLFSGKLLHKQSLQKMKPIIKDEVFGRGLMLAPFYQHLAYGHGGDIGKNHSLVQYNPEENLAISFALNGARFNRNDFSIDILNIIYGKSFEYPKFYNKNIKESDLNNFVGIYSSPELPQKFTFKIIDHMLFLKNPVIGVPYIKMVPLKPDVFKIKEIDGVKITFLPDQKALLFRQDDESFKMSRQVK